MAHDVSIDALAATQHGVVSRGQLVDAGMATHVIDYRVAAGRLLAVHPGVYRLPSHVVGLEQRLVAACLAAGPTAVVSHRGAAYLHKLDGVEPRVEVTTGVGGALSRPAWPSTALGNWTGSTSKWSTGSPGPGWPAPS